MASRNIEVLTEAAYEKALAFQEAMDGAEIPFVFTSTLRTQEEQDALYEQGRSKPGPIVTWTRRSKHIEGIAFDIAIVKDGRATWNMKVDVNGDDIPDYQQAGEIGESLGLTWGGRWKTPDYPHFQLDEA